MDIAIRLNSLFEALHSRALELKSGWSAGFLMHVVLGYRIDRLFKKHNGRGLSHNNENLFFEKREIILLLVYSTLPNSRYNCIVATSQHIECVYRS